MSSTNHAENREVQQDARAWADFTGIKYTAALRQITSPYAQGFLGDRVSARHLIAVLDKHELVGAEPDGPILSDNGFYADEPWRFDGKTDYVRLALVVDVLRMFTPTPAGTAPEVSSYRLKHTAERFLDPHCSYVSNGRLIWAAAALGLDMVEPDGGSLNLLIGISEREHDYVRRTIDSGRTAPGGHHHRPAGFDHLQAALGDCAAGRPAGPAWIRPTRAEVEAPFHDWLTAQAERDDPVGDFAGDYRAGVHDSDHRIARTPSELLSILYDVTPSPAAYDAGVSAIAEWFNASPTAEPVRTDLISSDSDNVAGYGAGAGTVERYRYRCPCGDGQIVEEHDNVPGFREHDLQIACGKCDDEWRLAPGRATRDWGLLPVT
ncbi:ribosomal protein S27AE [Nocardioides salarius]|uniref:Ribosomal protein S27AE n=1 Tax=Nocardioides salarius TaxID=374513 RepID=A0ABS2MGD9_9ACTN|nr:hypothetical protein [Nocardioides salarius]MBM7510259.1 ribosomal protein S27AE [Nocardioides salarius]